MALKSLKEGQKVLLFGVGSIIFGPVAGYLDRFLRKFLDPESFNPGRGISPGMLGVILSLGLAAYTLFYGVKVYKAGERSWEFWTGLGIAVLVAAFWAIFIVGEIAFPH